MRTEIARAFFPGGETLISRSVPGLSGYHWYTDQPKDYLNPGGIPEAAANIIFCAEYQLTAPIETRRQVSSLQDEKRVYGTIESRGAPDDQVTPG